MFVDGEEVAHHVGAFTPFRVDVPEGEHLLAVAVHAAPESEAQVGRTSRVRVHKSRMGYGWDFCPRLVHQGIWRPVDARSAGRACSRRVTLRGRRRHRRGRRRDAAARRVAGAVVAERHGRAAALSRGRVRGRLPHDRASTTTASSSTACEMPIRGWNWVPLDVLYGVPRPEKLERLLDARGARERQPAARVGRRADREPRVLRPLRPARHPRLAGVHPVELGHRERAVATIRSSSRRWSPTRARSCRGCARHPSLALWCGGNELDGDDSTPVLGALRDVVRELDPGARLAADVAASASRTSTGRGSTRGCASTTSTTTRARRCCTASSASRG